MVAIILWLSAVCSAFVDNIPFSATMVPVIQSMSRSQGVDLSLLAWALSIGTDLAAVPPPSEPPPMWWVPPWPPRTVTR